MVTQRTCIIRIFLTSAIVTAVIYVTQRIRSQHGSYVTGIRHRAEPGVRHTRYRSRSETPMKLILLGNSFWRIPDWELGLGQTVFQNLGCQEECFITNDQQFFNQSAAVLYHIHELGEKVPPRFSPQQIWIFFMLECPGWSQNLNYRLWRGHFNWTMTYRLDSDIPMVYGEVIKSTTKYDRSAVATQNDLHNVKIALAASKEKLVAWMVSNCNTQSQRSKYVRQLQKYIPVDVYGRCGDLQCPKNNTNQDIDCMDMISRKYKFYLAFENSFCTDYVTEKFFKTLRYPIVPVVRGGAAYRKFVPAGEIWYINADNFDGPKDLADYLLYLDKTPSEYSKYLEGRARYEFRTYFIIKDSPSWCKLCQKLHNSKEPTKVYQNIGKWWGPQDCTLPQDLID